MTINKLKEMCEDLHKPYADMLEEKERNEYEDNTNNEDEDLEEDHVDHLPNVD